MADLSRQWTYQSAEGRALAAIILLSIHTGAAVLATLTDVWATLTYPQTWSDPDADVTTAGETAAVLLLLLAGVVMLFSYLGSIVAFCMWQHRVAANARALGAEGMQISPGWNVGWWFIPFANLVMPARAMRENYNASRPDAGATDWSRLSLPPIIGWWWATWLISNIIGNATFRMTMSDDIALVEAATWLDVVGMGLTVICFVLVVRIIRAITGWQTQTVGEADAMIEQEGSTPPVVPWRP